MANKVPANYYNPLDDSGFRTDKLSRPELSRGVYDIIAPKEYLIRDNVLPNIIFLIEFSPYGYTSGIIH